MATELSGPALRRDRSTGHAPATPAASPASAASAGARSTSRSPGLDLLRVLAVVAVVAGHNWTLPWVRTATFTWHVPVFFVLAGYLWRDAPTPREDVRRRAATLLRPYLTWLVLLAALWWPFLALTRGAGAVAETVPGLLLGGRYLGLPWTALWFLTALFGACVLHALLRRARPAVQRVALVAALAITALPAAWLAAAPGALAVAVPAVVLLAAGAGLRRVEDGLARPRSLAAGVLAGFVALVVLGWQQPVDLREGDLGRPVLGLVVVAAGCCAAVLLARGCQGALPRSWHRPLAALGATALPVVVVHPVFAHVRWPGAWSVAQFAVMLVVPWAVALLAARSRWSPWLVGR